MRRVRINAYGPSNSAKELARYLGVKRLLSNGRSRFNARSNDIIINWGNGKVPVGSARQINNLEGVRLASNKLQTLKVLDMFGVPVVPFVSDRLPQEPANLDKIWVARTSLSGHSGQGIVVGKLTELPPAPLYTLYVPKVAEYRVIVVGNKAVDVKMKKKRSSPRDEDGNVIEEQRIHHDPHIWNLDGGYIMAREGFDISPELKQTGIDAVKALGLEFGAVDIIQDEEGYLYVLEVNTAFGLEGQTIELVGEAIREIIKR